jgi:hypothetical protein
MQAKEGNSTRFSKNPSSATRAAAQALRPVCYIINDAVSRRPVSWTVGDRSHTSR